MMFLIYDTKFRFGKLKEVVVKILVTILVDRWGKLHTLGDPPRDV